MSLKLSLIAAACLPLVGCCFGETRYVEQIGPMQAMTVDTMGYSAAPQQAHRAPRVIVTRRYMGSRPAWYETGYYLPEPRIVRDCHGDLYVEEWVWGFAPTHPPQPEGLP